MLGNVQREANAKLEEVQGERDEALQRMTRAQVLLIVALIVSICNQMSDDMFPLHFIQREKDEALREARLKVEEVERDADQRLEQAQEAAAGLEVMYIEWACVHI